MNESNKVCHYHYYIPTVGLFFPVRLSVSPLVYYKHGLAMFSTSARASTKVQRCSRSLQTPRGQTCDQLHQLLRETAQPVAVVTMALEGNMPISTRNATQSAYHRATLSLFTSIAFDPLLWLRSRYAYPLARQLPSIPMSIVHKLTQNHSTPLIWSSTFFQPRCLNLAITFSRADLHPCPFEESRVQ